MHVMIVVTHLLGTGHLIRAATLARAFARRGHQVHVVSGGMSVPHLDTTGFTLHQLPGLRSDGTNFTTLLDANNAVAGPDVFEVRIRDLVELITSHVPDVLITELFPFGRRVLAAEFEAALSAAKAMAHPPVILSSIRDILAPPSKPQKAERTANLVDTYYDAVLVHSDPALVALDHSWPVTPALAAKLRYTGFVAPTEIVPHPDQTGTGEVLVSAGGGLVGDRIFEVCLAAAPQVDKTVRLLVSGPDDRRAKFQALAADNVVIEPPRSDFRSMLLHAAASVSMIGYNTAMDVLQSGVRTVLIPFDDGAEVEQTMRAKAFAALEGIEVLASQELSTATLISALQSVLTAPARAVRTDGLDGADQTAVIAEQLWAGTQ